MGAGDSFNHCLGLDAANGDVFNVSIFGLVETSTYSYFSASNIASTSAAGSVGYFPESRKNRLDFNKFPQSIYDNRCYRDLAESIGNCIGCYDFCYT